MIYRRQRQQYLFGGLLAILAAVNILFFLILNRPALADYVHLQESIKQSEAEAKRGGETLANLQKTTTELEGFEKAKRALQMTHLLERNLGYSEVISRLDKIARDAGVKKDHVTYTINATPQSGLHAVSIVVPVEGNYRNIVNFIRELESSETFFLITAINLESVSGASAQTGPGVPAQTAFGGGASSSGTVALSLAMETYFYQ